MIKVGNAAKIKVEILSCKFRKGFTFRDSSLVKLSAIRKQHPSVPGSCAYPTLYSPLRVYTLQLSHTKTR